ncbi:putative mediator of RNA polymerase II transcription subunit 29 isoform X2 [Calliphora vicina]|uniref:putative mediator of RNA polymerase II transcription subunit 29 isoform X2 n=1 Tax=Calliphora vicina TaxID=7373 RepID=UPI00325B804C
MGFKTSLPSRMKMEKTPRYTQRERNMVLGYAAQYKDIIENKRTDAESNRKKDEVWRQIAKEFNARVYHQRSSKQLRQLYKNMKLLLKKDLCGEGKGNRTFMDLLNTISQQESVAQYISEQMSPNGYSNSGRQKYDDDYDDSKHPVLNYDGMDHDVIVIKSEDISDNEQSHSGEAMDEDDDDCLSPKDIPEVCLEEEDEELFATDLRQQQQPPNTAQQQQQPTQKSAQNQQQAQSQQNQQQPQLLHHSQQPEITIQNIGGIRVGSIGSMANMKALQNVVNNNAATTTNSALSITHANGNAPGQALNLRQTSAEQQLLLNGLGLSAVNHNNNVLDTNPRMPTLQRASQQHSNQPPPQSTNQLHLNTHSNATQQLLLNINGGSPYTPHKHYGQHRQTSTPNSISHKNSQNDYFMLGIEERKLKIELLNAQIEYWKKLTKKLDENPGHQPNPSCMCHFPGKANGVQTPSSTS